MSFDKFSIVNHGEMGKTLHLYFKELVDSGFTREEALQIVIVMLQEGMRSGKN